MTLHVGDVDGVGQSGSGSGFGSAWAVYSYDCPLHHVGREERRTGGSLYLTSRGPPSPHSSLMVPLPLPVLLLLLQQSLLDPQR